MPGTGGSSPVQARRGGCGNGRAIWSGGGGFLAKTRRGQGACPPSVFAPSCTAGWACWQSLRSERLPTRCCNSHQRVLMRAAALSRPWAICWRKRVAFSMCPTAACPPWWGREASSPAADTHAEPEALLLSLTGTCQADGKVSTKKKQLYRIGNLGSRCRTGPPPA